MWRTEFFHGIRDELPILLGVLPLWDDLWSVCHQCGHPSKYRASHVMHCLRRRGLLHDPDDDDPVSLSLNVLGELGSLGVAIPIEPLVSLLDHEDDLIVEEEAEALCKFGERTPSWNCAKILSRR